MAEEGHGLPWRPSAGVAGPPQKAAALAGDHGFRVEPHPEMPQLVSSSGPR
jgi:hypothetical protein